MAALSLHVPVAIILLAGGLVSGFFGYRLLRLLLAVYGFIGGIVLVMHFGGDLDLWARTTLTIGAGVAGAALAIVAYLAGVALLGAAAGAAAVTALWTPEAGEPTLWIADTSEPGLWIMLGVSLAGAIAALVLRRYVIITGTALGGSWAALVGGLALAGNAAAVAAAAGDMEQIWPLAPAAGRAEFVAAWLALSLAALIVQVRSRHKRV